MTIQRSERLDRRRIRETVVHQLTFFLLGCSNSGDRKHRDEPDDANMYKQFFGLREDPLNVSPDPRCLLLRPQTREALDDLTYVIQVRQGLRRPGSHGRSPMIC